jgi:acyl CoA:acetate/3-ketoacid CoA transferase beta subunit
MGASQLDAEGNQNISNIGPWAKPTAQLLGVRGAPGNTVNHTTSYWVPNHSTRVFVPQVDVVCGLGYRRAAAAGAWIATHHEIRRVVTNKAVLDFNGPGHRCRLVSVHPGVTVDDVVAATGFELLTDDVAATREPTSDELAALDRLDPGGARHKEVRP